MVTHTFNSSTAEAESERSELEASLAYRVSTRTSMAAQRTLSTKKNRHHFPDTIS